MLCSECCYFVVRSGKRKIKSHRIITISYFPQSSGTNHTCSARDIFPLIGKPLEPLEILRHSDKCSHKSNVTGNDGRVNGALVVLTLDGYRTK